MSFTDVNEKDCREDITDDNIDDFSLHQVLLTHYPSLTWSIEYSKFLTSSTDSCSWTWTTTQHKDPNDDDRC